jgi:hypothetical protein
MNPILALCAALNRPPNWLLLYTLAHLLPTDRFALADWSETVAALAQRRVQLPSYAALLAYLHEKNFPPAPFSG